MLLPISSSRIRTRSHDPRQPSNRSAISPNGHVTAVIYSTKNQCWSRHIDSCQARGHASTPRSKHVKKKPDICRSLPLLPHVRCSASLGGTIDRILGAYSCCGRVSRRLSARPCSAQDKPPAKTHFSGAGAFVSLHNGLFIALITNSPMPNH